MIELSFFVLVALLIASNSYWAIVCLKLTNRLMSRNYGELLQAENKPVRLKPIPEDMSDPVAERHAHDMNSLIGLI
jgi:hypothetical protein